jgi:hypothetical protein
VLDEGEDDDGDDGDDGDNGDGEGGRQGGTQCGERDRAFLRGQPDGSIAEVARHVISRFINFFFLSNHSRFKF